MVASRHVVELKDGRLTGSGFYAANPELKVADRYPAATAKNETISSSTFFAASPELMTAHRYSAAE